MKLYPYSVYFAGLAGVATVVAFSALEGCQVQQSPVRYQVSVPEKNRIQLQVELTQKYGLGLSGAFDILNYGSVFLLPETANTFFSFGFSLNTGAFLKDNWVNYQEVTTLPTGALFPVWMTGPVIDLKIPPMNTDPVEWDFYFGTHGQLYLGAAAGIHAINQNFPNLHIEYSFYDPQGRVILGLVFYGPQKDDNGNVLKSGGIFVGSNITPFLPPEVLQDLSGQLPTHPDPVPSATPGSSSVLSAASVEPSGAVSRKVDPSVLKSASQPLLAAGVDMVQMAQSGRSISVNGKSVTSKVQVKGPDAAKYQTADATRALIQQFINQSK